MELRRAAVLSWIARAFLIVAGFVASWLVAKDAPIFSVIQMTIAVLMFVLVVFVLAFWPASWTMRFNRHPKQKPPPV